MISGTRQFLLFTVLFFAGFAQPDHAANISKMKETKPKVLYATFAD